MAYRVNGAPWAGMGNALTPRQVHTLDRLIALGAKRPTVSTDSVSAVARELEAGVGSAIARWTEKTLYLTKSALLTSMRCEGQLLAERGLPRGGMVTPVAVGLVAHRAIQLSYTHPGLGGGEYVRQAAQSLRSNDEGFSLWWNEADPTVQSDLLVQATSRLVNFLDDFPPLQEAWSPRFEEPAVARVGKLTLSTRPDLVMGRPRGDGTQTMLIVDFKSGDLKEEHLLEARFYALVAALRHGVPPWRSTVYSLASGDYTDPDITLDVLQETAAWVVERVNSVVDVLTDTRGPVLTPGPHCRYCPARTECPQSSAQ